MSPSSSLKPVFNLLRQRENVGRAEGSDQASAGRRTSASVETALRPLIVRNAWPYLLGVMLLMDDFDYDSEGLIIPPAIGLLEGSDDDSDGSDVSVLVLELPMRHGFGCGLDYGAGGLLAILEQLGSCVLRRPWGQLWHIIPGADCEEVRRVTMPNEVRLACCETELLVLMRNATVCACSRTIAGVLLVRRPTPFGSAVGLALHA